jgi:hypothetical protein
VLKTYHDELSELKLVEKKYLLKPALDRLNEAIKPGTESLNWNSLGIEDFIFNFKKSIEIFIADKRKVFKDAETIQICVNKISDAKLIKEFDWKKENTM